MSLPSSVKAALHTLSPEEQKAYRYDYSRRAKSTFVAYLAWLLLGWHYLYLDRVGMQFAFWCTGGFLFVGWLLDFFRVPGMVSRYNEDMARALMMEHKVMAA